MQANALNTLAEVFDDLPVERRRQGVDLASVVLDERARIGALLRELNRVVPFDGEEDSAALLDELCSNLETYVALVHFGIFRRVTLGEERRNHIRQVAVMVYPRIERSSERVLEFEARYRGAEPHDVRSDLVRNLSVLRKNLDDRFALEDRLLDAAATVEVSIAGLHRLFSR